MSVNKFDEKNYEFKEDSFNLVQIDKKIHDVKFETKPTTFAKDALKRFVKNRSSVVGAIIIGLLLICSIILPFAIPHDIKTNHNEQSLLPPKLFEAGTGWWDGTKKYSNIPWDSSTNSPADFRADCVFDVNITNVEYTNQPSKYGTGGFLRLDSQDKLSNANEKYNDTGILIHSEPFMITRDGGYTVDITFGDEQNLDGGKLAEYRLVLTSADANDIVLTDWSSSYQPLTVNLSDALRKNGYSKLSDCVLNIEMTKDVKDTTYLLVKTIEFKSTTNDPKIDSLLKKISLLDATKTIQLENLGNNKFPIGFWRSDFKRNIYKSEIRYSSFTHDEYKAKLGLVERTIGGTDIQKYVENGWIEYDFAVGPSSFRVLDQEKSPITKVYKQSYSETHNVYNIEVECYNYKYLGYDSMPSYMFGTTIDGKDLVKLSFNSLRTSLLIAILVAAVCFMFGLCWGSISGYFGGNIDLAMERFCEILSGVPYIVVMTLIILLLGNSIGVFAFGLCITGWMGTAARTRTQFYRFKGREYVLASRTLGASDKRLIFKHILPNALGTIVTSSVLMVPGVIFSEATLAYLNLGLQGVDSFGVLLSNNQKFLSSFPMLIIFPATIISLLMISFNLFGNGLRDALNPSLKGSE